ncbi:MAG: hypothetical protein ACKOOF_09870 [Planctomycetaceae bacterium]
MAVAVAAIAVVRPQAVLRACVTGRFAVAPPAATATAAPPPATSPASIFAAGGVTFARQISDWDPMRRRPPFRRGPGRNRGPSESLSNLNPATAATREICRAKVTPPAAKMEAGLVAGGGAAVAVAAAGLPAEELPEAWGLIRPRGRRRANPQATPKGLGSRDPGGSDPAWEIP